MKEIREQSGKREERAPPAVWCGAWLRRAVRCVWVLLGATPEE